MGQPPSIDHLAALRRRFLMEDSQVVADWLWGEHPQTAAFVLNWIGDLDLSANYLSPLPAAQQADVLCRMCYLEENHPLDSFQEELLIEALQCINPAPRAVEELDDELDRQQDSGLSLVHSYLDLLPEEEFNEVVIELEELDRNLARLCHNRYVYTRETGGNGQRNLYGILNNFCDFVGYKFNRSLGARTVVFVDSVALQSDAAQARAGEDQGGCFKVTDQEGQLVVFMRFAPRLLYHYLEMSYGAPRPFFHANFEKPSFTSLEQHVAVVFAEELANALLRAVDASHADQPLLTKYLEDNMLSTELAQLGEEMVLQAGLVVRMAKSTIGNMQLIFPASRLRASDIADYQPLPGVMGVPAIGPDGVSEEHVPDGVMKIDGEADGIGNVALPAGEAEAEAGEEADTDLENLLFQSALEDAENAQNNAPESQLRPLDLLLAGYDLESIEHLLPEREDELRRMAEAHYHYGSLLFQRELFGEASDALGHALGCNPDHGHAQLLLAASWGEQGLYLKEILSYRRLEAEQICLPEAHVLLARRLSFLGKINESLEAVKKAYKMGFNANEIVETDPCFAPLRNSNHWRRFSNRLT